MAEEAFMSIGNILIVVLLFGLSLVTAMAFGKAVSTGNEAENRKILRSLRASSQTQIKRIIYRLSCWYVPQKERKKHRIARVA